MENYDQEKLQRVKKQVQEIKGFYIHLAIYLIINVFILANIAIHAQSDNEVFWKWSTFFTAIFWGMGLLIHAFNVFDLNPFFGKDWEKRQIQKYMEEDRKEMGKYK